MSTPDTESLPADVPEADWAEQGVDAEEVRLAGFRSARADGGAPPEVNEADLAEQETLAYGAEEDFRG